MTQHASHDHGCDTLQEHERRSRMPQVVETADRMPTCMFDMVCDHFWNDSRRGTIPNNDLASQLSFLKATGCIANEPSCLYTFS